MLILKANDVEKLFDYKKAIEKLKEAFLLHFKGKTVNPLRTSLRIDKGNVMLFMPTYIHEKNQLGIKIVSSFENNLKVGLPLIIGHVLIFDGKTGYLRALIDGSMITKLRTAATSALATDYLSRKDSKTLGIFGSGVQAESHAFAISEIRNIELIKICSRNEIKAKNLCNLIEKNKGIKSIYAKPDEVAKCDIIVTATTSATPVFEGIIVNEGTHINAIGSHTPETREIDDDLVLKCNKIVVESKEAALFEAGDLIIPIRKGLIKSEQIIELGEIIAGNKKGRESSLEITLFKSVGLAIEDVLVANYIYEEALKRGVGINIEL
jgi:Predicted ornithine cyclodeaminase, mu-crystallin homolog